MSTFSNRKRPRRLGQPIFPIEDPVIEHTPSCLRADLTSDLDAVLADTRQQVRTPEEPIGLRVPEDVRAAFERAQRSARVAHSAQPRFAVPDHAPVHRTADQRRSTTASDAASNGERPRPTLGDCAYYVGVTSVSKGSPRSTACSSPRYVPSPESGRSFLALDHKPAIASTSAIAAMTETPAQYPTAPSSTAFVAYELELPLPARRYGDPLKMAGRANHPLVLVLIGLLSAIIILWWKLSFSSPILSFQYASSGSRDIAANLTQAVAGPFVPDDHRLRAAPSLSPAQIDHILRSYGSPATGTGEIWYRLGVEYNIDPAYALAFFIHESSAGTNPNWAGRKPDGSTTHNVGNIICAGYPTCYGRFRDYPNWETGIADWYRLIDVEYIGGRGLQTVAEVIPIYAPAVENDVQGYINAVTSLVDQWRAGQIP